MYPYIEAPASVLFILFYSIFSIGFVFQFREFAGIGLSPENLLGSAFIRCSEEIHFIQFHLKRTTATLLLHSLLPLGFLVGYSYFSMCVDHTYSNFAELSGNIPFISWLVTLTVMVPISVASLIYTWSLGNWTSHPFHRKMMAYAADGDFTSLIRGIDTEFRRIDKFTITINPMTKVVVTDNWIIKIGPWPWNFHLAHQSDVTLSLVSSDRHQFGDQYLIIEVHNRKPNSENFSVRLSSLEYQNLTDKLQAPVRNARNIQILKTMSERFVEVFRQEVERNPKSSLPGDNELDNCIGCMLHVANVRLIRRCDRTSDGEACLNCYCRPLWCLDCMGKWFASRQNQREPETWLSSKCPCPTCRNNFCILDVSLIEQGNHAEGIRNE